MSQITMTKTHPGGASGVLEMGKTYTVGTDLSATLADALVRQGKAVAAGGTWVVPTPITAIAGGRQPLALGGPIIGDDGTIINPATGLPISAGPTTGAPVAGVGGDLYKPYDGSQATLSVRAVAVLGTSTTTDMLTSGLMQRAQLPAGITGVRAVNAGNGILRVIVGVGDEPAAAAALLTAGLSGGVLDIAPNSNSVIDLDPEYPSSADVYVYWVVAVPNGGTLSATIGTVSITGIGAARRSESQILAAIPCPYVFVSGHGLTGDPVVKSNISGFPTSITPSGGDGNVWGTDGFAHPSSEALRIVSEAASAFGDLSTLTGVFVASIRRNYAVLPTTASAIEYFYSFSIGSTTPGGWAFGHQQSNQKAALKWRAPGSGTVATVVAATTASGANVWKHLVVVINTIDGVASLYADGELDASASLPAAPYPAGINTVGMCVWGEGQSGGTANQLGSKGSTVVTDMAFFARCGDVRAKVPDIAHALFRAGASLPANLDALLTP